MRATSFRFAATEPWIVRFLLLFCRRRIQRMDGGWIFVFKTLQGQEYLVDILKARKP